MKKIILMFAVIMITLTVNAQEDLHVKVFKSITVEDGYSTSQKENFTFHVDRTNSLLRIVHGRETMRFVFKAEEYFEKDGYICMVGFAKELSTLTTLVIQIDLGKGDSNKVRLIIGDANVLSTYLGYSY